MASENISMSKYQPEKIAFVLKDIYFEHLLTFLLRCHPRGRNGDGRVGMPPGCDLTASRV